MLNVILLGLTSLLTDLSSEMIVPILPSFIQSVGGTAIAVGLVFGVGDAVAALLRVFSGYWADKTKRYKLFVLIGYAFSSVAKFGYAFVLRWPHIAIIRPIERLGKGFRDAPRDAIVSESITASERGKAFGIQRAMDGAGSFLGAVTVLVLFVVFDVTLRNIFLASAVIGLTAVIPILFVRTPRNLRTASRAVSLKKLSPKVRRFIAVATVFALANFSYAFLILRAQSSFPSLDARQALGLTLLLYIFFNIFDAVFSEPAGSLSDRIGRRKTILIGFMLFALVMVGFLALSLWPQTAVFDFVVLVVLFALYGLFKAFVDASQRAFVSDLSEEEVRATALGAFETLTGLAAIPAGLAAGYLYGIAPMWAFVYGLGLSLIATLGLVLAIRRN